MEESQNPTFLPVQSLLQQQLGCSYASLGRPLDAFSHAIAYQWGQLWLSERSRVSNAFVLYNRIRTFWTGDWWHLFWFWLLTDILQFAIIPSKTSIIRKFQETSVRCSITTAPSRMSLIPFSHPSNPQNSLHHLTKYTGHPTAVTVINIVHTPE